MVRDYILKDFIYYPNLALKLAMAPTYHWSGSPKLQQTPTMSFLLQFGFLFGAVNLVYQNIGMITFLFIKREKDPTISEDQTQLETLAQISETGGIMGLSLVGFCKMCMLYWHKKRIQILLEEFEKMFPTKSNLNYKFYCVDHFARQSAYLMKNTTIFFIFAFGVYNFLPIVEFIYETVMPDEEFQYRLQSYTWYPWQNEHNQKSIISFIVAYICQASSSLTGVAFIMAGEFLLCFFISQIQMHFEYLANSLEALDASGAQANDKLKSLITYHTRLLRYAKEINDIFNISFFVNFLTSSIAICLMGFSMVMISAAHAFKYSVGLMSFLVFTLFICYNGNEFTKASDKIMPSAFYNNWYEGNKEYRKMILFFVMRSSEPNYLRAYKFNTVSMETYMTILKMSYRLFTFFKAMS